MKNLIIEIQVPTRDAQNVAELVEKIGEVLEMGLQESSWDAVTVAEEIGCDGNTLTLSVNGKVLHEVCL